MRLAILTSHPVQYYAPLFRELAERIDIHVFFAHRASAAQQGEAGFGTAFDWDVDLESGYPHTLLTNVARNPNPSRFFGCDTPEIGERLREGKFDAVLSLGWHLKSLLQGIWAAKRMGLPVIVRGDSQLGLTPSAMRRMAKALTYPVLLRRFDAACYVGERNRAYFRHYGYPDERLFHSPHAVDTARFSAGATARARAELRARLGLAENDRLVLFAGKLVPFKRPLDAVEAVAQLRAKGTPASLAIAGSGALEHEVRQRAATLDVPLHALGFVNQSRMPAAYAAADALLLPSTGRETWGLVANEALACGTPAVISDEAGCAPDLCRDSGVALAYRGGDPSAASIQLATMLLKPPSPVAFAALNHEFTLACAANGIVEAARHVTPG